MVLDFGLVEDSGMDVGLDVRLDLVVFLGISAILRPMTHSKVES